MDLPKQLNSGNISLAALAPLIFWLGIHHNEIANAMEIGDAVVTLPQSLETAKTEREQLKAQQALNTQLIMLQLQAQGIQIPQDMLDKLQQVTGQAPSAVPVSFDAPQ